ncbi:hypothetical protein ACFC1L_35015 [Streptomyces sp. NPDC056210]|uniref:hypothetical protein n=1 Tax=Streptomyces sp. NPDC056210 TaxID=3345746 RepID=UPI0035DFD71A
MTRTITLLPPGVPVGADTEAPAERLICFPHSKALCTAEAASNTLLSARPLCGNWITQGHKAQADLPVPYAPLQRLWQKTAEEAVQGGTDCVQGLRDGDSATLTGGLEQIHRAAATFLQFATRLQQIQDGGTSQGADDK